MTRIGNRRGQQTFPREMFISTQRDRLKTVRLIRMKQNTEEREKRNCRELPTTKNQ